MSKPKNTKRKTPVLEDRSDNRLTVEYWAIDRLKPYEKNARVISESAVAEVAKSLKAFGFRQPIVVDESGVVLVGHTRLRAAKSLGHTEVPVHVAYDLSEEQKRAYRLADNKVAEHTTWDEGVLAEELKELQALVGGDLSLVVTGFDGAAIDEILAAPDVAEPAPPVEDEDDPVDTAEKPASTHECPKCGHQWRVR